MPDGSGGSNNESKHTNDNQMIWSLLHLHIITQENNVFFNHNMQL